MMQTSVKPRSFASDRAAWMRSRRYEFMLHEGSAFGAAES
jgi:hypothetical protein